MANLNKFKDSFIEWSKGDTTRAVLFYDDSAHPNRPRMVLFSKFGICNNEGFDLSSQITNHYTEDNTVINDHWAINPTKFMMSGEIGDVIYTPPTKFVKAIESNITNVLTPLRLLSPTLDNYTKSLENVTQQVEANIERYRLIAEDALNRLKVYDTKPDGNNQTYVFKELERIMNDRQLVTIHTTYGVYNFMAITKVSMKQGGNTYSKSTLEVEMQQWRDVYTLTRSATKEEKSQWASMQQSDLKDKGVASTTKPSQRETTEYALLIRGGGNLINWTVGNNN